MFLGKKKVYVEHSRKGVKCSLSITFHWGAESKWVSCTQGGYAEERDTARPPLSVSNCGERGFPEWFSLLLVMGCLPALLFCMMLDSQAKFIPASGSNSMHAGAQVTEYLNCGGEGGLNTVEKKLFSLLSSFDY